MIRLRTLLHPAFFFRRLIAKAYEFLHPNDPWIVPAAVNYCAEHLSKDQIGLEWGSGRSTTWFAQRLESLLSVEYDAKWHAIVVKKIQEQGLQNVECRHVPLEHDLNEGTVPHYDKVPAYVRVAEEFKDESLDFVVVDGHYRQACVLAALPKIRRGGLLLVDNTDWLPLDKWCVPASWPIVHQSAGRLSQTTIWRKP